MLNVVFETWVFDQGLVVSDGIGSESLLLGSHDGWVLVKIELDSWVLEEILVVCNTSVSLDVLVKLNSWVGSGLLGNDNTWVWGSNFANGSSTELLDVEILKKSNWYWDRDSGANISTFGC